MIVAFLQNMWVRDPNRVCAMIAKDGEELRLRLIEYSLFAGCVTGRRLTAAFGDRIDDIIWEETTREIAGDPKTIFPPQLDHMRAVLKQHQPKIVITFGRIAEDAMRELRGDPHWPAYLITVPHPAARQPDTIQKLKQAAADLEACLLKL